MIPYTSTASREYVRVPVSAREGSNAVNPTSRAVSLAFVAPGTTPGSSDWVLSTWETDGSTYYGRCTIGPGGDKVLTAGMYVVWAKVSDVPEIPVRPAGFWRVV